MIFSYIFCYSFIFHQLKLYDPFNSGFNSGHSVVQVTLAFSTAVPRLVKMKAKFSEVISCKLGCIQLQTYIMNFYFQFNTIYFIRNPLTTRLLTCIHKILSVNNTCLQKSRILRYIEIDSNRQFCLWVNSYWFLI